MVLSGFRWFCLFSLFLILVSGCISQQGGSPTTPQITQNPHQILISTGPTVEVKSQTVSPAGGIISINVPNNPLNGLSIEVPPHAFTKNTSFVISYSPITQHTLGQNFHPITPLIHVTNDGGYSNEFMIVKIPIKIPEGDFAAAFLYDEKSGDLEALPLIDENSTFIAVGTRHFSDIVGSSIPESHLTNITADSNFRPGVDDWQFKNYGSIVTPGGQCSGMSKSAIWYYYEQKMKRNAPSLYGLYDNNGRQPTPSIWQDDALAYRFTSVVQKEYRSDINSHPEQYGEIVATTTNQNFIYNMFAYSILVEGKPQLLSLMSKSDPNQRHQVIVYKASLGYLHIADPNHPGDTLRMIGFSDGAFQKYQIDERIGNSSGKYIVRSYVGYSQIPWDIVWSRWSEFEEGTVGIDLFPAFDGYIEFKKNKPDGPNGIFFGDHIAGRNIGYPTFELNSDDVTNEIKINAGCDTGTTGQKPCSDPSRFPKVALYLDGQWSDQPTVILKEGENEIGIGYYSIVHNRQTWVGFDWITINYMNVTPTPTPTSVSVVPKTPLQLTDLSNGVPHVDIFLHTNSSYSSCYPRMIGIEGWGGKIDRIRFDIIKIDCFQPDVPLVDVSLTWCENMSNYWSSAWGCTNSPHYPSCDKRDYCSYLEASNYIPIFYGKLTNATQLSNQSYAGTWSTIGKERWGLGCGKADDIIESKCVDPDPRGGSCGNYFTIEIQLNTAHSLDPNDEVYIGYTAPGGRRYLYGKIPPQITEITCIK